MEDGVKNYLLEYENDMFIQLLYNTITCVTILAIGMLVFIVHDYEVRYKLVSIGILPVLQSLVFHTDLLFSFNFEALRESVALGEGALSTGGGMRVEDKLHLRRKAEVAGMVREAVAELRLPEEVIRAGGGSPTQSATK